MPRLEGEKTNSSRIVLGVIVLAAVAAALWYALAGRNADTTDESTAPSAESMPPLPPDANVAPDGNAVTDNAATDNGANAMDNSAMDNAMGADNSVSGMTDNGATGNAVSDNATDGIAMNGAASSGAAAPEVPQPATSAAGQNSAMNSASSNSASGNKEFTRQKTITNNKNDTTVTYKKSIDTKGQQQRSVTKNDGTQNSASKP